MPTPDSLPKIDLALFETVFSRLEMRGVQYDLGAKAGSLKDDTSKINRIDCSGFARYIIAKATQQALIIPDGSWNQRDWCERVGLHRLASYNDVLYATPRRLFICFITPHVNGAGDIGHVWFVSQLDGDSTPDTMESHGGVGIDSRPWNARVLKRECAAAFELPVAA
jgi:hypothetical protein